MVIVLTLTNEVYLDLQVTVSQSGTVLEVEGGWLPLRRDFDRI